MPMIPAWYDFVYRLACEFPEAWRWIEPIGSPPTFIASLQQGTVVQAVAIHAGDPVGFVWCFDPNDATKQAHIAAYYIRALQRTGIPFEATALFLDHVFATYGYEKVYANTTDPSRWTRLANVVSIEGRLQEHCFVDGRWRDFYMIAIPRDRWTTELTHLRAFYSPSSRHHGTPPE